MTAIGDKKLNRWHLQIADRWVVQYNFYVNDRQWGRMFVRICPYLPFSARVYLNQHHWLANRMREEGIDFQLNVPMPSRDALSPNASSNSPTRSPLRICCVAAKVAGAPHAILYRHEQQDPAAGIDYSSRR